jgi:hypothetical protein
MPSSVHLHRSDMCGMQVTPYSVKHTFRPPFNESAVPYVHLTSCDSKSGKLDNNGIPVVRLPHRKYTCIHGMLDKKIPTRTAGLALDSLTEGILALLNLRSCI